MYRFSKYKEQYKANLLLALPVVLTQLGQILTQVADNLMVGRYGGEDPVPLAAVSFGGAVFFILFITAVGVALGMTPLVGELYARGDRERSASLLQNGILFYTLLGIVISAVQYAAIPLLYHLGQPAEVVDVAIPYYRMLVYSMPFIMLFFAFKQFLEGVGNTKVEMVVTIVSNLANIGFNWVFIYGRYGFAEMGAQGAGLGTLLSRMIAPVLMIGYFLCRDKYRAYLDGFSPRNYSWATVRSLLRMGLPISSQMFLEASAFVGTGIMMGWLGTQAMSANQIAITLGNCAFMIVMSIGAATTIRVSHCYGARNIAELSLAAKASYHLVLAWNTLAAVVFITLRHWIPSLFTQNAEVIAITSELMFFAALYQLSDGVQNVSVGILRGIQDVKIIMPIAFVSYWLLNLPVGYLFGFTWGMGPSGLFLGFSFGLSAAAVMMIVRIRRSVRRLYASGPIEN
ncbi:MATE family efflux transporter [Alistipes sp.]|uniref:MATE family efflux transporter n=1 Tax=Alistipes sp. TaxID=1872444 RepID=UPI003AF1A3F3